MTREKTKRTGRFVLVVLLSVGLGWLALSGLDHPVVYEPPEPTILAPRSPPPAQEPLTSSNRLARSERLEPEGAEVQVTPLKQEARPTAVIEAHVDGSGWVRIMDCRVLSRTRRMGAFRFVVAPGRCDLRGERRDGMLTVFGDPVTVFPEAGDHLEIDLALPTGRMGGIGVRFRPDGEGMRVVHLVKDSPAWAAGLEPGDLIVEVNGEATANMQSVEFIQKMTGEEGTEVSFVIGWDADTGWTEEALAVERSYLSG